MTDGSTRTETHSDEIVQRPRTVESRSFQWSEGYEIAKTALFRVRPGYAVLQHVRTTTVTQRTASTCEIDTDATLDDVPNHVLEELRATGREIASGGGR